MGAGRPLFNCGAVCLLLSPSLSRLGPTHFPTHYAFAGCHSQLLASGSFSADKGFGSDGLRNLGENPFYHPNDPWGLEGPFLVVVESVEGALSALASAQDLCKRLGVAVSLLVANSILSASRAMSIKADCLGAADGEKVEITFEQF